VRVIENRALNKLRHPQRNYRLKDYMGTSGGTYGTSGKYQRDHDHVIVASTPFGKISRNHGNIEHEGTRTREMDAARIVRTKGHDFRRTQRERMFEKGRGGNDDDALSQFTPENIWSF